VKAPICYVSWLLEVVGSNLALCTGRMNIREDLAGVILILLSNLTREHVSINRGKPENGKVENGCQHGEGRSRKTG